MSAVPGSVPVFNGRTSGRIPDGGTSSGGGRPRAVPENVDTERIVDLASKERSDGVELPWRLDEFNKFLLSAAPMPRITAGVGREVCATLGFSRVVFLSTDFKSCRAKLVSGHGFDPKSLGRIDEPFKAGPWIEECVRSGWPAYVSDAKVGPAVPMKYVKRFKLGPLLCIPICDSRGPVGAMILDRGDKHFGVDDQLMEAARAAGLSIGLALEAAAAARTYPDENPDREFHLTPRERQMLRLLSRGLANKEIATATGLSVYTVRDYVSSLLRCLDVTCRSAAVARAWELGLLGESQKTELGDGVEPSAETSSLVS